MSAAATGFVAAKHRALLNAQPLSAFLELTYRCNWRCVFCYNPRHGDLEPLSLREWEGVLDDLRTLGGMVVTLTGGEPLAHPEFFGVAEAVRTRALGLKVFTNVTLVTDSAASRLAALRPISIETSLHGATAPTHDRTTQVRGSFDALWRGVERLRRHGLKVVLKTLLTRHNAGELDDMIDLAARVALPLRIDVNVTPRDDGDRSPVEHRAGRESIAHALRRIHESGQLGIAPDRDAAEVNCGLGRLTLAVDPEGNVYPCMQWRQSALGNVRERPLRDLWRTAPARREAAAVAEQANTRLREIGGATARFPYCPALSAQHTGDPLVPDAGFVEVARLADEARKSPL